MEYRNLGNSGLQVSLAGLGTNNFGAKLDREATEAVVHRALDHGVTFFDTADSYVRGRSEELLGAILKPMRHDVIIATKTNMAMGEGPYWSGNSRRYLIHAADACLRRLDTDYIDVLQMHRFDQKTPHEETMRALDDLVREGKVRYIGSSTYTASQLTEAQLIAGARGWTPLVSSQNTYNLLEPGIEKDLAPAAKKYGVGIIPSAPLARGFLTGKYRPDEPPPEGARLADQSGQAAGILTRRNFDTLIKLEALATEHDYTMVELALGWLANHDFISTVIAGASTPEQVDENVLAIGLYLPTELMTQVDALLPPGTRR